MKRAILAALSVMIFVVPADAQTAQAPAYSVGDTWKRSNGAEIKVVKVAENRVQMAGFLSTCRTCIHHMDKNLTILNVAHEDGKPIDVTQHGFIPLGTDWKLLDFPLEVKKTWRITPQGFFRGAPARYTVDVTVLAYEDVKTKAGTFKAFKIQYDWTNNTRFGDFTWTNIFWFAPDVKLSVKFTSTNLNIEWWELVSYNLK